MRGRFVAVVIVFIIVCDIFIKQLSMSKQT